MTRFLSFIVVVSCAMFASCRKAELANQNVAAALPPPPIVTPTPTATPAIPNLQAELLDERNTVSKSPIAKFDFRNYTYELPRGWQNPDGTDQITLVNGRVDPVSKDLDDGASDESKAEAKSQRRIGMTFVAAKFFDLTGDGEDEAVVILKVETGGSAVPQIVHIFSWKDGAPELLWPFRTGDRADGGLKNVSADGGNLVVELFGQDRFLLGQIETGRITDDREQLCCPTHFTRSVYKWNGRDFLMQGKRLTFSIADPGAAPQPNLGDIVNNPKGKK